MKSPAEILTALAALWSRISSAIGRGQAEKAREQQREIEAMDAEIQAMKGTSRESQTEHGSDGLAYDERVDANASREHTTR